jgi:hypothetical protein
MQDPISVKDVQKLTGELPLLIDSFPELQREACLSFKFSEVQRTFSGPNLRSKLSKSSKIIYQI